MLAWISSIFFILCANSCIINRFIINCFIILTKVVQKTMSLKYVLGILALLASLAAAQAQQKFTISGTVRDQSSGEELFGATILVQSDEFIGTTSNEYGFYSLSLPEGDYTIVCSYVGFADSSQTISLKANQKLNWGLGQGQNLAEVVVDASKEETILNRTDMGTEKLDIKEISKLPVIFGEKDILKTIQLLPGVKSAGEGNSGFFVRGGAADQNLILLDEAPVYNASHLLGFFSTFNSDAIKDATLIKGNSPAQYGGRLASVLDIKMKEGNDKKLAVAGGVGLISSRISIEAPLQKGKSSFIVAGRRTYADVFLKLTEQFKDNTLYFYDLNTKANYRINDRNRLFLSGYFGRDVLGLAEQFGIDWGNITGTLRWNSIINPKLFSNTSLIFSNYDYKIKITGNGNTFNLNSKIRDWNFKEEMQYFANPRSSWRFGINAIHHTISPSRFESDDANISSDAADRFGLENAAYVSNKYNVSENFNIEAGLRLSAYSVLGGDTYNVYENGELTDSIVLAAGNLGKTYFNLEPRLSMSYQLDKRSSVKAAYARNTQHLHLLSNSTTSSPTDQWVGNSYNIKPEISDQVSAGYYSSINKGNYELSAEVYYKSMQNQVDYKNGADINTAPDLESELLFGKGRAYGLELYFKKKTGKLTGWISYTLARTERQIEGINDGNWYAARQDRTHDISVVAMYQISKKWSVSGVFVYYTGNAVTFPSGKYEINGNTIYYYTERNGYRMPAYHRMDLSATYESMRKGRFQGSWNFSLYNAYGRENAYIISFENDPNDPSRTRAVQTSLFKWVPSVTYNFSF